MIAVPEWFLVVVCLLLFLQTVAIALLWWYFQISRDLISAETIRKETHTSVFEQLSNPDVILSEMEASAVASEALRAKRHTKVRDDAGPHAIVHKPPLRSVQPRSDREKFFKNMANEVDTEPSND